MACITQYPIVVLFELLAYLEENNNWSLTIEAYSHIDEDTPGQKKTEIVSNNVPQIKL